MRVIPERSESRCRDARRLHLCEFPPTGWAAALRLNLRLPAASVQRDTKGNAWTFRITNAGYGILRRDNAELRILLSLPLRRAVEDHGIVRYGRAFAGPHSVPVFTPGLANALHMRTRLGSF